jgi:23S rRNA (adenine2503-C2)-methyltransferase
MQSLPLIQPGASPGQIAILDCTTEELAQRLAAGGYPPLRARQIRRWLLVGRASSFDAMTDLPAKLRAELARSYVPFSLRLVRHLQSADQTHKLLLQTRDQRLIECVLIQQDGRKTACISTQVGCGMGCVFCASGLNGVERNLSAGEIIEQLVLLRNLTGPSERLTHIVVMGMGEPLANLTNLLAALEVACDKDGLGIGARHVTISTVGLPGKIRKLAEAGKQYHLAVSLHAPNDALRSQIVPTNAKTGIRAILEAADAFQAITGRQVTYEYVLLGGLNDSPSHGRELARLLHGRQAHVNLIPFNHVAGLPYRRPSAEAQQQFIAQLRQSGISVKVRKRRGADIDAACGQLRRQFESRSTQATNTLTVQAEERLERLD